MDDRDKEVKLSNKREKTMVVQLQELELKLKKLEKRSDRDKKYLKELEDEVLKKDEKI